ncbi:hypothetical protein AU476_12745 [Cupriavidus sp. UYMSc13B]|nr:hypothetical protein AU476_12745 [Cupriavidus sp. UYMSc13B]
MAAINVAVAFFLGKFAIRYVNHRHAILKSLGLAALAFSLFAMVGVAMSIAHYRDGFTAEVTTPASAVLAALIEHPLQLRDFDSWVLFFISMGFAIGSLFDGLLSDDFYPGYGAISRRTQTAVDDHADELNTLRVDLDELKNEELKGLDNTLERAQADVAVFESLIKDKQMAGSRLSTALLDADNSLEALLRKFRTENELHRKGLQRPMYFDRQPDLRPIRTPDFSTAADEAELQEQRKLVKALLAEVQDIRASIQAAFNQHFDRLKPLDTHFPAKEFA